MTQLKRAGSLSIINLDEDDSSFHDFTTRFGIPTNSNSGNNGDINLVHDTCRPIRRCSMGDRRKLKKDCSEKTLVSKGSSLKRQNTWAPERRVGLEKVSDDFALPKDQIDVISRLIHLTNDDDDDDDDDDNYENYEDGDENDDDEDKTVIDDAFDGFESDELTPCISSSSESESDESFIEPSSLDETLDRTENKFEYDNRLKYTFGGLTKSTTQSTNSQIFSDTGTPSMTTDLTSVQSSGSTSATTSSDSIDGSEEVLHVSQPSTRKDHIRFISTKPERSQSMRNQGWKNTIFYKPKRFLGPVFNEKLSSEIVTKKVDFGYTPNYKSIKNIQTAFSDCGGIFRLFKESKPGANTTNGRSCLKPYDRETLESQFRSTYAPKDEDEFLSYNESIAIYNTHYNRQLACSKGETFRRDFIFNATEADLDRKRALKFARQVRLMKILQSQDDVEI